MVQSLNLSKSLQFGLILAYVGVLSLAASPYLSSCAGVAPMDKVGDSS